MHVQLYQRLGRFPRRKMIAILLSLLACCILAARGRADAPVAAAADSPTEYEVKAAFLLNFVQFTEWPENTFPSPEAPILVGVLGTDPFGSTLEQTFKDELVDGRRLEVRRSHVVNELKGCHVIFVAYSERDRVAEILTSLGGASILTVGDPGDFCRRGGIIQFYMEEKRVRFAVNAGAAERKGLKISAQLLKRAKIVG